MALFGDDVQDGFGYAQVLDSVAADIHLWEGPELVSVLRGSDYLSKVKVHPRVNVDEVAVIRLAVLQLDKLDTGGKGRRTSERVVRMRAVIKEEDYNECRECCGS